MADNNAEILKLLDDLITQYKPGGSYEAAQTGLLEKEKGRAVASGQQSLVSSGLSGTTVGAGLPGRWEQDVGAQRRADITDIGTQRLAGLAGAKLSYLQNQQEQEITKRGQDISLQAAELPGLQAAQRQQSETNAAQYTAWKESFNTHPSAPNVNPGVTTGGGGTTGGLNTITPTNIYDTSGEPFQMQWGEPIIGDPNTPGYNTADITGSKNATSDLSWSNALNKAVPGIYGMDGLATAAAASDAGHKVGDTRQTPGTSTGVQRWDGTKWVDKKKMNTYW